MQGDRGIVNPELPASEYDQSALAGNRTDAGRGSYFN